MNDEKAIRNLIKKWTEATKKGDIETVLDLMTDDVVFMVVEQKPFGKKEFKRSMKTMQNNKNEVSYNGENNIEELKVFGEIAYARTHLKVTMMSSDESTKITRSGYALSLFRKEDDGKWRLSQDANLLTIEK